MRVKTTYGIVELGKNEYVAQGGEGTVYIKNGTAYKIFHTTNISQQKINELKFLGSNPNILAPDSPLFDTSNKYIGYSMPALLQGEPVARLIAPVAKRREHRTELQMIDLVGRIRDIIRYVHNVNCLIVDVNELNFLLDPAYDVFAIDVDSYKTPNFPPTAIMDHIRDRHNKDFAESTDWFSWGILSFLLLVGIHPYKGKHPKVKGLDSRMQSNISVFSSDVTVPASCPAIDAVVPPILRDWYKAVFDVGLREPPPLDFLMVPTVKKSVVILRVATKLHLTEVAHYGGDILNAVYVGDKLFVVHDQGCEYGSHKISNWQGGYPVVHGSYSYTIRKNSKGRACVRPIDYASEPEFDSNVSVDAINVANDVAYFKSGTSLYSMQLYPSGFVSTKKTNNVMPHATKLYPGCAIQNVLGTPIVEIPGGGSYIVDNLRGCKVITARYEHGLLGVLCYEGSDPTPVCKYFFLEEKQFTICATDRDCSTLNFCGLSGNRGVRITQDGRITVWNMRKSLEIADPAVSTAMTLFSNGINVFCYHGYSIYKVEMPK